MPRFALRFDGSLDSVLGLLDSLSGRYLATRENVGGENEHVHVFLECDSNLAAVRKRIQRSGHWTGNAGYSAKACKPDWEGFVAYICKGESALVAPVVLGRQGFTTTQITSYHERYYVTAEVIAEARRKSKKLGTTTVVQEVLEEARNTGLRWTDDEKIAEIYIRKYTEAMKPYNEFHCISVIRTVKVLLDPEGDALANAVASAVGRL